MEDMGISNRDHAFVPFEVAINPSSYKSKMAPQPPRASTTSHRDEIALPKPRATSIRDLDSSDLSLLRELDHHRYNLPYDLVYEHDLPYSSHLRRWDLPYPSQ